MRPINPDISKNLLPNIKIARLLMSDSGRYHDTSWSGPSNACCHLRNTQATNGKIPIDKRN